VEDVLFAGVITMTNRTPIEQAKFEANGDKAAAAAHVAHAAQQPEATIMSASLSGQTQSFRFSRSAAR
jgi:hypothetical protein